MGWTRRATEVLHYKTLTASSEAMIHIASIDTE